MIGYENQILNLRKETDALKSLLLHDQLKHRNYSYTHLRKDMEMVLNKYRKNGSIVKSAIDLGFNVNTVLKWYFEGQKGDVLFKFFSDEINRINHENDESTNENEDNDFQKDYEIIEVDGNWIYSCILDDEKHSLIANDLGRLKQKVMAKNLPID